MEAKRLAAYWSFPPTPEPNDRTWGDFALRDAHIMGYPFQDYGGLESQDGDHGPDDAGLGLDLRKRIALLPEKAERAEPSEFASLVRELDAAARSAVSSIRDATVINFLDDLTQFSAEPNLTPRDAANLFRDSVHGSTKQRLERSRRSEESPVNRDDEIRAKIDQALTNPAMNLWPIISSSAGLV